MTVKTQNMKKLSLRVLKKARKDARAKRIQPLQREHLKHLNVLVAKANRQYTQPKPQSRNARRIAGIV